VPSGRELAEFPLSELLGVLSFGVDLGMGQPMEHVLVAWVGCHVDAYEQAKWFGDDTVLKGDFRRVKGRTWHRRSHTPGALPLCRRHSRPSSSVGRALHL
jgi:hypothetical protein